jgi:sugar/nucleoside kinase (ribokinase family)
MKQTPHLLIIGSPSIDILHIKNRTVESIGGAGLYTALAAYRCGCQVSLYGIRPDPVPEVFMPLQERLVEWLGPTVPLADIPHFEIAHHGDKAEYLIFDVGAEADLLPSQLPEDLSRYAGVHITSLGTADTQVRLVEVCRQRGAKLISSGSFLNLIQESRKKVSELIFQSDVFFLNEDEAQEMFGSIEHANFDPEKFFFITRGKQGAIVVQGDYQTKLPAIQTNPLDPTGAGDTFCGATMAHLLQGEHPIMAARKAAALASEEIKHVGPTALLFDGEPPEIPLDRRIEIDQEQVQRLSEAIKGIPESKAFDFVSDYYPPVGHQKALDYFFVQTLQQFGFWDMVEGHYAWPLIATIDGQESKGSTFLSRAYLRPLDEDPDFYSPARQSQLTFEEVLAFFRADDGSEPLPGPMLHFGKALEYGNDMLALDLTPRKIVDQANRSSKPLQTFLSIMDHIGGYKADPLRKKSSLLALILMERPEKFLKPAKGEEIQPVVDYHCLRFCLRTGLVTIINNRLRKKVANRAQVTMEEEGAIRFACYQALQQLVATTGLSTGAVDNITFGYTRKHCPEMTVPVCKECALNPACKYRVELFQPVLRTTFY